MVSSSNVPSVLPVMSLFSMLSASSHRKVIGPSHSSSEDAAKVTQNASKWQNSEILVSVEPTERCGKQYAALFSDLF